MDSLPICDQVVGIERNDLNSFFPLANAHVFNVTRWMDFFNICPLTALEIRPKTLKICQSKV